MAGRLVGRLEEGYGYGAGTYVGADGGADGMDGQLALDVASPQRHAVLNILLEHRIRKSRIAKRQGHGEVDAARLFDLLVQQVTTVLGAARQQYR